jgi:hypothetical protein
MSRLPFAGGEKLVDAARGIGPTTRVVVVLDPLSTLPTNATADPVSLGGFERELV